MLTSDKLEATEFYGPVYAPKGGPMVGRRCLSILLIVSEVGFGLILVLSNQLVVLSLGMMFQLRYEDIESVLGIGPVVSM